MEVIAEITNTLDVALTFRRKEGGRISKVWEVNQRKVSGGTSPGEYIDCVEEDENKCGFWLENAEIKLIILQFRCP